MEWCILSIIWVQRIRFMIWVNCINSDKTCRKDQKLFHLIFTLIFWIDTVVTGTNRSFAVKLCFSVFPEIINLQLMMQNYTARLKISFSHVVKQKLCNFRAVRQLIYKSGDSWRWNSPSPWCESWFISGGFYIDGARDTRALHLSKINTSNNDTDETQ